MVQPGHDKAHGRGKKNEPDDQKKTGIPQFFLRMNLAQESAEAAAGTPIIGARAVATIKNACPQFGQNAAPSANAAPHLEQYTVSPCFFLLLTKMRKPARMRAKSYFQAATRSITIPVDHSRLVLQEPGILFYFVL